MNSKLETLSKNDQEAIRKFARKLQKQFGERIQFIKVFGSKIRGTDDSFSDIDLFVLIDQINLSEKHRISELVADINLQYDVVVSPVIFTLQEYQDPVQRITPFFQTVMTQGVLV